MELKKEIWKDVPEYEGLYQVSNLGRVRSLDKWVTVAIKNQDKRFVPGKLMQLFSDRDGYLRVGLTKNHKKTFKNVHIWECLAFYPNPENKPQVNHKNGVKFDNRLENLEWSTLSENRQHAYDTGLQHAWKKRGVLGNFSKLNNDQVIEIRKRYIRYKVTSRMLAKEFDVTSGCILSIISRKSWAWL